MRLKVLGSESLGNGYVFECDGEALIIEAGVKLREVKKALNFNLAKVDGCIVSHSHGDHSKYIREYAEAGIDIFTSLDVINTLDLSGHRYHHLRELFKIGEWWVKPFEVPHNVPNYGFLLRHPEIGLMLFVTDAAYIKPRFPDLNHILIEANYSTDAMVNDHGIGKHMSLDSTMKFLQVNNMSHVYNIVLLHLSAGNSNEKVFTDKVRSVAPHAMVHVADKGVEIELKNKPF